MRLEKMSTSSKILIKHHFYSPIEIQNLQRNEISWSTPEQHAEEKGYEFRRNGDSADPGTHNGVTANGEVQTNEESTSIRSRS